MQTTSRRTMAAIDAERVDPAGPHVLAERLPRRVWHRALPWRHLAWSDDAKLPATGRILNRTIKAIDIATESITTGEIKNGSIAGVDMADGAVTTAKIADDAVTAAKLAADVATVVRILDDTGALVGHVLDEARAIMFANDGTPFAMVLTRTSFQPSDTVFWTDSDCGVSGGTPFTTNTTIRPLLRAAGTPTQVYLPVAPDSAPLMFNQNSHLDTTTGACTDDVDAGATGLELELALDLTTFVTPLVAVR